MTTTPPKPPATDEEIADREEYKAPFGCDCTSSDSTHAPLCSTVLGPRLIARIRQEQDGRADDQKLCVRRVAEVTRERNDLRVELAASREECERLREALKDAEGTRHRCTDPSGCDCAALGEKA